MTDTLARPSPTRWPHLILAALIAGVIALSIHVVMLQGLGVPYPEDSPPLWTRWLNLAGTTTALIAVIRLAGPRLGGAGRAILTTGLALVMIKESLRGAIMTGVVTSGWAWAPLALLPGVLLGLATAAVCVLLGRWARSPLLVVLTGMVAGGLTLVLQPLIGIAVSPLMAQFAHLAHPEVYQTPYPWFVLIPAYATFAEPVIAALILAALIWDRLPRPLPLRLVTFTLLVVLLKGVLVRAFLFAAYMDAPYVEGLLSQSQFLLEFAALGLLIGLSWHAFGEGRRT